MGSRSTGRGAIGITAAGLIAGIVIGGCGGGSSSNMAAFCADNAKLDKAAKGATSADQILQALKDNKSTIDDFAKTAPAAIKSDANVLVKAARDAMAKNDATPLTDAKVSAAGQSVDAFCGQNSGTSTNQTTTG